MSIAIIAVMDTNRVIGSRGQLPWHLPNDLKRFKRLTMGKVLVMGRKTYESLPGPFAGGPLPGRELVVISHTWSGAVPGGHVVTSLQEALAAHHNQEVMIIGGAKVFADAMPLADRLFLTQLDAQVDGDVFFPPWSESEWRLVASEQHEVDDRHAYRYRYDEWARAGT